MTLRIDKTDVIPLGRTEEQVRREVEHVCICREPAKCHREISFTTTDGELNKRYRPCEINLNTIE